MAGSSFSRPNPGIREHARPVAGPNPVCARQDSGRATLSITCEARQGLQPWTRVRLEDLSPGGFRLVWPSERIDIAQPLRIRVPGLQVMTARICWLEGNALGCAFARPLHVAVFEHIVRMARARTGPR